MLGYSISPIFYRHEMENENWNEKWPGKKSSVRNDYSASKYVGRIWSHGEIEISLEIWVQLLSAWIRCAGLFLRLYRENDTHLCAPPVFASSCLVSAWAWVSEGMKSAADLHQWVLPPQPCSNPTGSRKYLKWMCHRYSTSNLHWVDMPLHIILFPQKIIWKVDINPNSMPVCLLCSISRKLGKAIELEAIKPTHQVLSVHEKKRKSVSQNLSFLPCLSKVSVFSPRSKRRSKRNARLQEFIIKTNTNPKVYIQACLLKRCL